MASACFIIALSWLILMWVLTARQYKSNLQNNLYKKVLFKIDLMQTRVVAFFTKSIVVYLLDNENVIHVTTARTLDADTKIAYVYCIPKIGPIKLYTDGTVTSLNHPEISYIYHWLPYDLYDRTEMILRYNARSFIN